jgi:hypothetical protein
VRELIGTKVVNEEGALTLAFPPTCTSGSAFVRSFGAQFNYQNRRLAPWRASWRDSGNQLKKDVRERYPAFLRFFLMARCYPRLEAPSLWIRQRKTDSACPRLALMCATERMSGSYLRLARSRRILEASGVEILED